MNEIATSGTALTPEQAFPFQSEIDTWNAESAIERLRPKVEQLKKVSVEVARDLFIAHEALAQRGGDRRSEDAQVFGFCDFLELVGLSKKTAYLWLKLYDPLSDRVRAPEELSAPAQEQSTALVEAQSEFERLVSHAMATGDRLDGWTDAHEREYKRRKENEKFAELARVWGKQKIRLNWKGDEDYFSQTLLKNGKMYTKVNLETKEQYRAQLEVFDILTAFLNSFENPQVRLAAVCNIGLRIRQLVNEIAETDKSLNVFTEVSA